MNIKTSVVTTHGSTMTYFSFGSGKTPFVMLPGISTRPVSTLAPAVANAYKDFADRFTVYCFDPVTSPPDGYTIYDTARDTAAALDELGIRSACVFGVSMGAMTAQTLAVERPDLVGKLILSSTASRISPTAEELLRRLNQLAQSGDLQALYLEFAKAVYTPSFFETYKDAITAAFGGSSQQDIDRFVKLTRAIIDFDIYDELEKISCPVLVIGAGEDKVFGVQASCDIAQKTGGKLYIYEGYGHAAYDEAPDYKQRLYEFFTSQE